MSFQASANGLCCTGLIEAPALQLILDIVNRETSFQALYEILFSASSGYEQSSISQFPFKTWYSPSVELRFHVIRVETIDITKWTSREVVIRTGTSHRGQHSLRKNTQVEDEDEDGRKLGGVGIRSDEGSLHLGEVACWTSLPNLMEVLQNWKHRELDQSSAQSFFSNIFLCALRIQD